MAYHFSFYLKTATDCSLGAYLQEFFFCHFSVEGAHLHDYMSSDFFISDRYILGFMWTPSPSAPSLSSGLWQNVEFTREPLL
eukprot:NODE_11354_length_308_cov_9.683398_g10441_i0.p1 GENE.NODE_11354_length_308_cov_9.683398_g10441_i0~~NODE_11354_length_308_cov_9.683398_g10441_i0.p1  ORF type:complete len:82 (+),score=0.41 NODE_11354_length_308_cov_9.683398_g10441_i0:19-264(+)